MKKHDDKIEEIYSFLKKKKHRDFNRTTQNGYYQGLIQFDNPKDRILSLLFSTVNTQSQPKLDPLAVFWILIYEELKINPDCLNTLEEFMQTISIKLDKKDLESIEHLGDLDKLWHLLKFIDGWGEKTAALFVKSCCNIHWDEANKNIRFWEKFPNKEDDNKIYLPVDRVIVHIFSELKIVENGNRFEKINTYLQDYCKSSKDMLIWDDLWFWGFITQKSIGGERFLEWNIAKYYAVFHAPKDTESINDIEVLAKEFIEIIKAD